MQIRIEGSALPGRTWVAGPDSPCAENVHVAVQRKDRPQELLDLQPGDAASASWTLECTTNQTPTGIEVNGPYVQNRLGGRFIYLSWVDVGKAGTCRMFRRAKLMFDDIDQATLAAAVQSGRLTGRLRLTDAKGHPLCARVRPPVIQWSAERADSPS